MPVERREAAEYLGVSVSTLDRLASQGKLSRGRARRKTRPVTTFDEEELQQLKAELSEKARVKVVPATRQTKYPDGIGFRLDPYYVERLKNEGEQRGMSAGEYARSLVVRGLEETAVHRFADEVETLRRNLSGMFLLILIEKFGVTEEEANDWIRALSTIP